MKIAVIYSKFPPVEDGGADYLEHFARTIALLGHTISVFTSANILLDESKKYPFDVHPIVSSWSLPLFDKGSSLQILRRSISSLQPDVIHIIYPDSTLGNGYQLPYLISLLERTIPVVTQFFSFSSSSSNLLGKVGVFGMLTGSSGIFLHSEQLLDELNRRLPVFRQKTYLVPVGNNLAGVANHAANTSQLRQELAWRDDHFHIGFYGAMDPSKGIDTLIEAIAILAPEIPDIRLHFIGGHTHYQSDYPAEVERLIRRYNLEQLTTFSGYLSREGVYAQLAACDICVLPFKRNVLGRSSLVSALSIGVPVITTRLTERSEYFVDRENVLLVKPSDPAGLSMAIKEMIIDRSLRETVKAGGEKLAQRLSWTSIASQAVTIYQSLRKKVGQQHA